MRKKDTFRTIPLLQAIYVSVTAIWPLVHIESFMRVTGYKTDVWLVKTVSVLLFALMILLYRSAIKNKPISLTLSASAISATAGLIIVELVYYFKGIIAQVYFWDAIIETIFLLWWINIFLSTYQRKHKSTL
ncbi:MAG: hypothetical protein JNM21_13655 [Taibaiella sp.]|nr:hypothetical protein [Taibaiella sp.]